MQQGAEATAARFLLGLAFWAVIVWVSLSWLGLLGLDRPTQPDAADAATVAEGWALAEEVETHEEVKERVGATEVDGFGGVLRITIPISNDPSPDAIPRDFWTHVEKVIRVAQESLVNEDDLVVSGAFLRQKKNGDRRANEVAIRVEFTDFRRIDLEDVDDYEGIADSIWLHSSLSP